MTARILHGDVFAMLPTIKPGSVDCCVSSPPYYKLRSYLPHGHHSKELEIGNEKTPTEYIDKMVRVFRLVRGCLADHGTCWLNIGDSYCYDSRGQNSGKEDGNLCLIPQQLAIALQADGWIVRSVICWSKPAPMPASVSGWSWRRCRVKVSAGDRIGKLKQSEHRLTAGLNQRTAEKKALSSDGKPHGARSENGKDFASHAQWEECPGCSKCKLHGGYVLRKGSWRPTSSWEPILMLAKSNKYFCDSEAVRQSSAGVSGGKGFGRVLDREGTEEAGGSTRRCSSEDRAKYDAGANPRDVWRQKLADMSKEDLIGLIENMGDGCMTDLWTIAAEPLNERHFAPFPTELVYRCLAAGTSSKGYCTKCGSPWCRVLDFEDTGRTQKKGDNWDSGPGAHGYFHKNGSEAGEARIPVMTSKTIGWRPSCDCFPDGLEETPRSPLALDPFSGSGRTAIQATRMGCDFIGVELFEDFVEMGQRLVREESPLFSGVSK